jgi:hypothetical protein
VFLFFTSKDKKSKVRIACGSGRLMPRVKPLATAGGSDSNSTALKFAQTALFSLYYE